MGRLQPKLIRTLALASTLCAVNAAAFEFEPGIGVGLEYTDNAALTADNQLDDLIVIGYVGAKLAQDEGPLQADITAALNHHRYTKDTFDDKRYFLLGAVVDWQMIPDRFDWFLTNFYRQRPINTFEPNTPDNLQDTNIFSFGADMQLPVSARHTFTLRPEYRNFYYELQAADNQQYVLAASWFYDLSALTKAGLNGSVREVDYDEPAVSDVTFASAFLAISTKSARSNFSTNLGATQVERDNGQSTDEFAGNADYVLNLTERSRFRAYISTDLTDTSSGTLRATIDPGTGDPNDIQIATDVIRNRVFTLGYMREDGTLKSSLTAQLRELTYSDSPNDREVASVKAVFNYPVTGLLTTGFYARYYNTDFVDIDRTDDNYTVGANVRYRLTRKLNTLFDLKYRNRDSTVATQNFDEWSAFFSLAYGFGEPMRPTRSGGF